MKTCSFIISILFFLFFAVSDASAMVWINEFSSNGSDDWVEFYNDGAESVSLETYRLRDGSTTNKLDLSGQIDPGGYAVFDWGTKLNNSGDTIKLVSASDENAVIDQVIYGNAGDIPAPAAGQSGGRKTNGNASWVVFISPSKNSTNADSQAAPTVTSVPEKTPTPVKEPTPTKTPTPKKTPAPSKASSISASNDEESETTPSTTKSLQTNTAKLPKISGVPTSILGISSKKSATPSPTKTQKPNETVMVKSAVAPPYFIIASGTVFCVACGILVFLKRRSRKQES